MGIRKFWNALKVYSEIRKVKALQLRTDKDYILITLDPSVSALPNEQWNAYIVNLNDVMDQIFGEEARVVIMQDEAEVNIEAIREKVPE